MQVKKFEARSMKEALEMVKTQLGPDAIILSARDNNRSFGLVGEGSVEITAAVSEETLQKKKFVESRLRQQDLQTFSQSPARVQKNIIEKMVHKYTQEQQAPKPITNRRYVDIEDEGQSSPPLKTSRVSAAEIQRQLEEDKITRPGATPTAATVARAAAVKPAGESAEVQALKSEIASLREVISKFQELPQTLISTHPGADYGIPFDLSFMFEKLTSAGVAEDLAAEILTEAQEEIPALKLKNKSLVDGWVARHLLETTKVTGEQSFDRVQVFVGPSGAGKTTALVKMASHLVVKEKKKVALLTTDTYKVGAADQMRIYAQILNVPFSIIRNQQDWSQILRFLGNVDVVLVDMPGLSLKSQEEIELLRRLMPPAMLNPRIHFTVSATSKDADVTEAARRYSMVGFDDVIFTSLDESAQHGTIYNLTRRFGLPLNSFGLGPRVPEDFEFATKERVLDLIFRITKSQMQSKLELR